MNKKHEGIKMLKPFKSLQKKIPVLLHKLISGVIVLHAEH